MDHNRTRKDLNAYFILRLIIIIIIIPLALTLVLLLVYSVDWSVKGPRLILICSTFCYAHCLPEEQQSRRIKCWCVSAPWTLPKSYLCPPQIIMGSHKIITARSSCIWSIVVIAMINGRGTGDIIEPQQWNRIRKRAEQNTEWPAGWYLGFLGSPIFN